MYNIALVEDEKDLNDLIKTYLEKEGYNVTSYYNGDTAIKDSNKDYHLWILDIMLGDDISGYDIIKKIREDNNDVPVIFTSARDKDLDKIIGLELGSDDYITKPYSPKELVLRVNNIIRRVYTKERQKITYKDYIIDLDKRIITDGMSVRDLERVSQDVKEENIIKSSSRSNKGYDHKYRMYENIIMDSLNTKVRVSKKKIEIYFDGVSELEEILSKMNVKVEEE